MKSNLKFILIGDNALVDENSGKLSVIGIFGNVHIPPQEKKVAINFVVAGQLFAEEATEGGVGNLVINIMGPDGEVFKSVPLTGLFGKNGKVQFTAYFQLVEFEKIGEYKIQVLLNGTPSVRDSRLCFFNVAKDA